MKLNKEQLEKLNEMAQTMKALHEIDSKRRTAEISTELLDAADSFILASEEFLFKLDLIEKKRFFN